MGVSGHKGASKYDHTSKGLSRQNPSVYASGSFSIPSTCECKMFKEIQLQKVVFECPYYQELSESKFLEEFHRAIRRMGV